MVVKGNRAGARVLVPDSDLESPGVLERAFKRARWVHAEIPLIYGEISRFHPAREGLRGDACDHGVTAVEYG